jgi:broad specificity phosphatase PhoE
MNLVDPLPGDLRREQAASWPVATSRVRHPGPHSQSSPLVYLARHGQTESNLLGRYAGYNGEPITDAGRAQMSSLATRLQPCGVEEIWTSEVPRARESADLVGGILGVPVRADERLNEMQLGPWEGMTETEVAQAFPSAYELWCTLPDRLVLAGRETLASLCVRVTATLADAARMRYPVLLMSHVAPIRVAVLTVLGLPLSQYKRLHLGNGDGVVIDRGKAEARRVNEDRSLHHEFPVSGPDSTAFA